MCLVATKADETSGRGWEEKPNNMELPCQLGWEGGRDRQVERAQTRCSGWKNVIWILHNKLVCSPTGSPSQHARDFCNDWKVQASQSLRMVRGSLWRGMGGWERPPQIPSGGVDEGDCCDSRLLLSGEKPVMSEQGHQPGGGTGTCDTVPH